MRANTDPCKLCEYCDDSCDVCLHQQYEDVDSSFFHGSSSCDEAEEDYASTDFDSASDEEGSWFTTPWSKLIAQRDAGYEVDPEIGVQLVPVEEQQQTEEEEKTDTNERSPRGRGRGRGRRRRRRQRTPGAAASDAVKDEALESGRNGAAKDEALLREESDTIKVEALGSERIDAVKDESHERPTEETNSDTAQQPPAEAVQEEEQASAKQSAPKEEREKVTRTKGVHENTWRESVENSIPQVTVS